MGKLESYNNLEELEKNFDVEYINNVYDFYMLVSLVQQENNTLYRGVCSPKYKMYSSSQRFYHNKKESLGLEYVDFLNMLYAVSPKIDNGYLLKLYDDLQKDNYIQYVNTDKECKSEKITLAYNPIWAFHTLQHLTCCSPFLDFTNNFHIALFFAAQEMSPLQSVSFSKKEIENYIEIVSFKESNEVYNMMGLSGNLYKSLTDEFFGEGKCDIKDCLSLITKYDGNAIKYISFRSDAKPLLGRGFEYRFSFENENCIAQSGRLYLTSCETDKPFEALWNGLFNGNPKLKVCLIHKSLIDEIYKYLTIHLLGKTVVPIQKYYKDEIIELIQKK